MSFSSADANHAPSSRFCCDSGVRLSQWSYRCERSHRLFAILGRYVLLALVFALRVFEVNAISTAVVVYPNCTSTWTTALQNGLANYDPTGCVGIFYSGARYYQVSLLYLAPFMEMFVSQVVQQASTQALTQYLNTIQGNATAVSLLAQVPHAVSSPFSFYQEDVRPINQWGVAAPFEAALIYYLILT